MTAIAKPFIPWVGGKERLTPYIHRVMPPRFERYIEPFGGSGAILLGLPKSGGRLDVYNDYNGDLVNLFRCVRDRPLALLRELKFLPLHSRTEFEVLKAFLAQTELELPFLEEELEIADQNFSADDAREIRELLLSRAELWDVKRAAAFYQLSRYSFSGTLTSFGGKSCDIRRFLPQIWEASRRLAGVVVENKNGIAVIRQYDRPGGLIYCDPPYYEAEKSYAVVFRDHKYLHRALQKSKSAVIVSYNDCPYIRALYQDFYIYGFDRPNILSQQAGSRYGELLITNYDPRPLLERRSPPAQTTLFQEAEAEPVDLSELRLIHAPRNPLKVITT